MWTTETWRIRAMERSARLTEKTCRKGGGAGRWAGGDDMCGGGAGEGGGRGGDMLFVDAPYLQMSAAAAGSESAISASVLWEKRHPPSRSWPMPKAK